MPNHLVIVGNGVAGITAALTARARDDQARITVVSSESDYFISRTALMYAFMDKLERRDLEPHERAVWKKQRIELVRARVTALDAGRRTLRVRGVSSDGRGSDSDGERELTYDALLLATGSRPRPLAAPGLEACTSGVVNFVSLGDLDACEAATATTRSAVVVGGGLIGIELVECLVHHGVKVTFLVREPWYFPAALAREEAELVTARMRAHGVDVRLEDELARVDSDGSGRVRAMVTKKGETIECQLLGVAIGVEPSVGWLKTVATPPVIERGIVVDAQLRTSLPSVWAAGDCAELHLGERRPQVEQLWYSAKRQGELAGANLTGGGRAYEVPLFYNSAKFFDVEYTTVGQVTHLPPGATSLFRRHAKRAVSQRIVAVDGRVIGVNLLGSRFDHTVLARWIDERKSADWVAAHLADAQFDVEFGRLDLEGMPGLQEVAS